MWQVIIDYISANPFEIIGAVLTVSCVWLNTRENIWGWIVGIISTLCYIYVFFNALLLGDFLLNIYFLVTSIYGWYHWKYGNRQQQELPVTRTDRRDMAALLVIGAVASLTFGALLNLYPKAAIPFIDAIPATFSVIAQWMLARKKLENWLLWVFVNILSVGIYFYKDLFVTAVLYMVLLGLAFKGYADWKKSMAKEKAAPVLT